jgi:hypothetical protein
VNKRQQKKVKDRAEREAWDAKTPLERLAWAEEAVVNARMVLQHFEVYRDWLREEIIATEPVDSEAWNEALYGPLLAIGGPEVPEEAEEAREAAEAREAGTGAGA